MGLIEVPEPVLEPHEVLMKVWAVGICGSDLLIEDDKHFYKAPVTLGHEFSGIAYRVGSNVKNIKESDHIVGDIETEKGWLGVTRDGAYTSYMALPEHVIYKIPKEVNLDHAALTEPVVATIHAMQERTTVRAGDFVVVVGSGPMGLMGVQFAKLRGASKVVLIGLRKDEKRLQVGKGVGADYILYSEEKPEEAVLDLSRGKGADFVLECSASQEGVQHAIDCARRANEGSGGKGVIAFISLWGEKITIQADAISLGQLSIHGSWSWNGPETWTRAVDLVSRNVFQFEPLITNRYSLEEWEKAFRMLREKQDIKALIYPNGKDWL